MKLFYPERFQGEKHLKNCSKYFEGWYFKLVTADLKTIAFIPGISITPEERHAFIQINYEETLESHYIKFPIESFFYSEESFEISIEDNYFSKEEVRINLKNPKIFGKIIFDESQGIKTNIFSPGIMGPFSFTPFMECYHGLIHMKSKPLGSLEIAGKTISFDMGSAYVEKDWGKSFPEKWIWAQGNNFQEKKSAFVFSTAKIPWLNSSFDGFFSILLVRGKEYKFVTYNGSKIKKLHINDNLIEIEIKKRAYKLVIFINKNTHGKLVAPNLGKMDRIIHESIDSTIEVKLYKNETLLYQDKSFACGCEIVNY